MNRAKKILMKASSKLELPTDIIAGVPRIELIGKEQCSIEPHRGLLVYTEERICIETDSGIVNVVGNHMRIKQMNASRIVISGVLKETGFAEELNE